MMQVLLGLLGPGVQGDAALGFRDCVGVILGWWKNGNYYLGFRAMILQVQGSGCRFLDRSLECFVPTPQP